MNTVEENAHAVAVKDPVCGMTVDPANAAATIQRAGQSFSFCGKGCAE